MSQHQRRPAAAVRFVAARALAFVLAGVAVAALTVPGLAVTGAASASAAAGPVPPNGCHLGNGVKHVIEITFDNVHFFRDNPNVPSDLEMRPHLLKFLEDNGTFLSNNHTPLIAHTANDSLTTYTGLSGDRAGMPVSNSCRAYNTDGSTDPAGSFAYRTDPVFDTAATPNPGHDTNPSMVYSPVPPATAQHPPAPSTLTPAGRRDRGLCRPWGALHPGQRLLLVRSGGQVRPDHESPRLPRIRQHQRRPDAGLHG